MKIGHETNISEKEALQSLLSNYRNTPHPATGISPAAMLFRDGQRNTFPRVTAIDNKVANARKQDLTAKEKKQHKINSGKYRTNSHFSLNEHVLVRNYQKTKKFDPLFLPDDYIVVGIENDGRCIIVKRTTDGATLRRHPDDLKKYNDTHNNNNSPKHISERETLRHYIQKLAQLTSDMENSFNSNLFQTTTQTGETTPQQQPTPPTRVTRSQGLNLSLNPLMNNGDTVLFLL